MIKMQKMLNVQKVQKRSPAVAISTKKQNKVKQQKYKNKKIQNMQKIIKCKKQKKYKSTKIKNSPAPAIR